MKREKGLHDEVARVAYELYKKRGRADGHDLDDWLEAEKTVTEKHERHARETEQQVDVIGKPRQGFRRHA
ncbi:MAG: DUF2934 domain-containing protein [Nitrospiraceae bacterium]|jgi:Protein of unknown function (DUF2934)|nr:MAG: DUF2934 domain-containing protein [Nitrospiraceae bacterium]